MANNLEGQDIIGSGRSAGPTGFLASLQDVEKTYMALRCLLAGVAFAFPIILVAGGTFLVGLPVLPQLSAYYFTSLGDIFVGSLCDVGIGLVAYKGFTDAEDIALNTGGVLICLVAMFHMDPGGALPCLGISDLSPAPYLLRSLQIGAFHWVHFACAVLFYVALGYVMVFCSHASLGVLKHKGVDVRGYTALGCLFVSSVLASFIIYYLLPHEDCANWSILVAEVAGLLCFVAFWILKTWEIWKSGADNVRAQFDRRAPRAAIRDLW